MTFMAQGAPPVMPYLPTFVQGYRTLEITVVGTDDLA